MVAKAENNDEHYNVMLSGGGLDFCRSDASYYCIRSARKSLFKNNVYKGRAFRLSQDSIAMATNPSLWQGRENARVQVHKVLEYLAARAAQESMTARELARMWKRSEIEVDGVWYSGREIYNKLSVSERNLILDAIELVPAAKDRKVEVALDKSRHRGSIVILKRFAKLARKVAGGKAKVLFVSAGYTDTFANVRAWLEVLNQLDVSAEWLPLDAAVQLAWKQGGGAACDNIHEFRRQVTSRFRREEVFPDLAKQQVAFCKAQGRLMSTLQGADAIFIAGEDLTLTTQTFAVHTSMGGQFANEVRKLTSEGKLVVAGDDAGAIVLGGGAGLFNDVPMIQSGLSHNALMNGGQLLNYGDRVCISSGEECVAYPTDLTYLSEGGLGLFRWGAVDTKVSQNSRQGRMIRLSIETQQTYSFGIDERTALLVKDNNDPRVPVSFKVMGEGGVYIIDNTKTQADETLEEALQVQNMMTHYLTHNDVGMLRDKKLVTRFASTKFSVNSRQSPILKSGRVFEQANYQRLANMLCTTAARVATAKSTALDEQVVIKLKKERKSISRSGKVSVGGRPLAACSYRDFAIDLSINFLGF
ncbi:type 1 glutamine amidotransferase family protein [Algicola sagamiensis]|uniref:hypothetical protein n=1 Tax=Algicola sagamiensis TaxID=163869 RepID=UPI00039FF4D7|nr:hypothetical protein [Algicola sagamiensis]